MRKQIQRNKKGSVLVEAALAFPLIWACAAATFQFTYFFYVSSRFPTGAPTRERYASTRSRDYESAACTRDCEGRTYEPVLSPEETSRWTVICSGSTTQLQLVHALSEGER